MKKEVYRHGDMVIFKKSGTAPTGQTSKTKKAIAVGLGEVSGHSHVVRPIGTATVVEYDTDFSSEDQAEFAERDNIYFEVKGGNAVIAHEEHGPIILGEGLYVRVRQVNFDPFEKHMAKVRD